MNEREVMVKSGEISFDISGQSMTRRKYEALREDSVELLDFAQYQFPVLLRDPPGLFSRIL